MRSPICWMPCGCSAGKSLQEIQEIAFEIGMLDKCGLDINDPQETHVLRTLPRMVFLAQELLCIMYAGFKRIEPGDEYRGGSGRRVEDGGEVEVGGFYLVEK